MNMHKKNWEPSRYQNDRLISSTQRYIKQKINDLQKELKCPNEFIFDFLKDIQQDWDPDSHKLKSEKLQQNKLIK